MLDAVGADAAHIAGWSMGGMIVQAMALRHPERILSMTSVMSAPGPIAGERDPDVTAIFGAAGRHDPGRGRRAPPGRAAGVGQPGLLSTSTASPPTPTPPTTAAGTPAAGRARRWPSARRPRGSAALGSLSVPTLVVHGDADRLVPLETGGPPPPPSPAPASRSSRAWATTTRPQYWDRLVALITTHSNT